MVGQRPRKPVVLGSKKGRNSLFFPSRSLPSVLMTISIETSTSKKSFYLHYSRYVLYIWVSIDSLCGKCNFMMSHSVKMMKNNVILSNN